MIMTFEQTLIVIICAVLAAAIVFAVAAQIIHDKKLREYRRRMSAAHVRALMEINGMIERIGRVTAEKDQEPWPTTATPPILPAR